MTRQRTGTYCRRKGHTFERDVAKDFREIYPKARRGLQYQDGEFASDIEGTPFRWECSAGKESIQRKWKQVTGDALTAKDPRPCLVVKKWDRFPKLVILDYSFWKYLCQHYNIQECPPTWGGNVEENTGST